MASSSARSPSTTAMVFSPWLFSTDSSGALAVVERQLSISCGPSTTSATRHSLMAAVAARDDDVPEILRPFQPRVDLHHALLLGRADRAHRQFLVLALHRGDDLVDADAEGFQRRRARG